MNWMVAFLLLPIIAFGQAAPSVSPEEKTEQQLQLYLASEAGNVQPSTDRVMKFIERLGDDPRAYANHQQTFVRQIFVKSHSRFLRTFKPNATFSQLFSNGNYNCLTATALIATTLQHFGYTFRMFETTHHIFILVDTDRGTTLLETTDPFTGFITDSKIIDQRVATYKSATHSKTDSRVIHYEFQTPVFKEVTLNNLAGLLHFNLSVNAYNDKNFTDATSHLELATQTYQSSRVPEFADVIRVTLKELNVPDAAALTSRLQKVRKASEEASAAVKFIP